MNGMNIFKRVGRWKCQPLIAEGRLIWKEIGLNSGRFYSTAGPDQKQGNAVMRIYLLACMDGSISLTMMAANRPQGEIKLSTWMNSDKFTLSENGEYCKLHFPEQLVEYYEHKMRYDVDVDIETLAQLGWGVERRLIRLR